MTWKNKTVWSEGLFVKPVHFQQQDRHIEHYISQLDSYSSKYCWGFSELTVDQDLLNIGKLAITEAKGIMHDGTPFDIPGNASAPAPIDIEEGVLDQPIYLCLPVRSLNKEYKSSENETGIFRYNIIQDDISDVASSAQQSDLVQVAQLNFTLLKESDKRSDYSCLAVSHIIECNKDKQLIVNKRFIAPALNVRESTRLKNYLDELSTLLEHRSTNLSARVTASGTGGAAEVSDFLLLQALNRNIPLYRHLRSLPQLHPEELYSHIIQLAGELSTFSDPRKPQAFNPYQHDKLSDSFDDVVTLLKEQLSSVIDPQSINIPLKDPKYGIYRALVSDPSLINTHYFVIAVKANVPAEEIRKTFPKQVKITSVEKIRDLIMSGLAGVELTALPVAPRKIPYHSGYVYFQLNKDSSSWKDLINSSGFALHIGGEYSGLELEFWAVKE